MRVLVCGGRDFGRLPMNPDGNGPNRNHSIFARRNAEFMFGISTLYLLLTEDPTCDDNRMPSKDLVIIEGGATGADTIASDWAAVSWVQTERYEAEWAKWGKAAGMIRNRRMLVKGKPDLVIAFPGGTGTANMVALARKAGVTTIEVIYRDQQTI